ncbi:hypothetical protein HKD37_08G023507 [Glycine soja]
MARDSCLTRVTAGAAMGGAVGGAVGAVYGTYEAIRYKPYPCICKEAVSGFEPMTNKSPRHNFTAAPGLALLRIAKSLWAMGYEVFYRYKNVPGLLKIRHIGQTTLGSAAIFGLFLGAGSLIHCGKSY